MKRTLRHGEIERGQIGAFSDPRIVRLRRGLGGMGTASTLRPSAGISLAPELAPLLRIADLGEFIRSEWEARPYHRGGRRGDFESLLSLATIDAFLAARRFAPSTVHVLDGSERRKGTLADLDALPDLREVSLYFHRPETYHEPLRLLCQLAEASFDRPATSFAFLTPPHTQARGVHWDLFDVFVLQVSGRKRWRLYDPVVELPQDPQAFAAYSFEDHEPSQEVVLSPGDVLYLPRGVPHCAFAEDEHSLHITLALRCVSWLEVVTESWRRALREAEAYDRAAPIEAILERVLAVSALHDHPTLAEDVSFAPRADGSSSRPTYQRGNILMYRARSAAKKGRAHVRYASRRMRHRVRSTKNGPLLVFAEQRVAIPAAAREALSYILARTTFGLDDLPGMLHLKTLKRLADRLTEAGFLTRTIEWR